MSESALFRAAAAALRRVRLRVKPALLQQLWKHAAAFVARRMVTNKAVRVDGLGRFTFSKVSSSIHEEERVRMPLFFAAPTFDAFGEDGRRSRSDVEDRKIPCVALSHVSIAYTTGFDKDFVRLGLKAVLSQLVLACRAGKCFRLSFAPLGQLVVGGAAPLRMRFARTLLPRPSSSSSAASADSRLLPTRLPSSSPARPPSAASVASSAASYYSGHHPPFCHVEEVMIASDGRLLAADEVMELPTPALPSDSPAGDSLFTPSPLPVTPSPHGEAEEHAHSSAAAAASPPSSRGSSSRPRSAPASRLRRRLAALRPTSSHASAGSRLSPLMPSAASPAAAATPFSPVRPSSSRARLGFSAVPSPSSPGGAASPLPRARPPHVSARLWQYVDMLLDGQSRRQVVAKMRLAGLPPSALDDALRSAPFPVEPAADGGLQPVQLTWEEEAALLAPYVQSVVDGQEEESAAAARLFDELRLPPQRLTAALRHKDVRAAPFVAMARSGMPIETVRSKMIQHGINPELLHAALPSAADVAAADAEVAAAAAAAAERQRQEEEEEEEEEEKQRRLMSEQLEQARRRRAEHKPARLSTAATGSRRTAAETERLRALARENKRYVHMLDDGVPRALVRRKMRLDGAEPSVLDELRPPAAATAAAAAAASEAAGERKDDSAIRRIARLSLASVARFLRMLAMGVPRSIIEEKMLIAGLQPSLLSALVPASSMPARAAIASPTSAAASAVAAVGVPAAYLNMLERGEEMEDVCQSMAAAGVRTAPLRTLHKRVQQIARRAALRGGRKRRLAAVTSPQATAAAVRAAASPQLLRRRGGSGGARSRLQAARPATATPPHRRLRGKLTVFVARLSALSTELLARQRSGDGYMPSSSLYDACRRVGCHARVVTAALPAMRRRSSDGSIDANKLLLDVLRMKLQLMVRSRRTSWQSLFQAWDCDGDGSVSLTDLHRALHGGAARACSTRSGVGGSSVDEDEDSIRSGLRAAPGSPWLQLPHVSWIFHRADKNRDGYLDFAEFFACFCGRDPPAGARLVKGGGQYRRIARSYGEDVAARLAHEEVSSHKPPPAAPLKLW